MPRKLQVPKYCHHKASGQAVVRIDGRDRYLGPYGSEGSYELYERAVAEWRLNRVDESTPAAPPSVGETSHHELTITELVDRYRQFAEGYYVRDGQPTQELTCMRYALRPVRRLYGSLRAREFGPLALKTVREKLVEQGLCRTHINARINRVKRFFKWAVSEELVPPTVYEALRTVAGLRYGRTTARESEPVKQVPDEVVNQTLPFVSPPIRAMIQLQRLTGMRPGEVVLMRRCDLDMTEEVWMYEPMSHKNRWRGHRRLVPLGPRAQQVLSPFLEREATSFLFSPRDASAWQAEQRHLQAGQNRKTRVYPCELRRRAALQEARRRRGRRRPPGSRYDPNAYRHAILYAIQKARKAGIALPNWHPNQLRHRRATELRHRFGIEAAQVSLGHARADVTQVYAERNLRLAIEIAQEVG